MFHHENKNNIFLILLEGACVGIFVGSGALVGYFVTGRCVGVNVGDLVGLQLSKK